MQALILLDTQSGTEPDEVRGQYEGMLEMWATVGPVDDLANTVAAIIISEPEESARWVVKWQARDNALIRPAARCLMDRDDITDRLGEITCPAVVVHGTADVAIPFADAEALAAGLRDCRGLVAVEGGGHAANLTHPEPVNAALLDFLRSL